MFEWLPIFHGKYFTYTENIFVITVWVFSSIIIAFGLTGLWLNRPKKKPSSNYRLNQNNSKTSIQIDSDEYSDGNSESSTSYSDGIMPTYNSETELLRPRIKPTGTRAGNACIWISWFWLSLFPGAMATFRVLFPMWFAVLIGYATILLKIRYKERNDRLVLYTKLQQKDKIEAFETQLKPLRKFYRKMTILATVLTFTLGIVFDGFCVSSFQDYVGPIFGTASLSSRLSRFFQLSKACPDGPPCRLYASLPEDTATSVFINVHTHEKYETILIQYDIDAHHQAGNDLRHSAQSESFELSGMENNGVRRVHSIYLDGLEEDTLYYFKIFYNNAEQASGYYKTLPDEKNKRELVIVQGGDMGNTAAARRVVAAAAEMKPDVVIIGGDMAYDNGFCTCYFVWDFFFKDLEQVNAASGRLVPLILAAGNHDMGIDPLSDRKIKVDSEGPFYMILFPQHSKRNPDYSLVPGVPTLDERRTYYYHKIGKILLVTLDSGYLADIETEQVNFMHHVVKQFPSFVKFGHYHSPIYYAYKDLLRRGLELAASQRKAWVPVFDQYNFALVFENDEHRMKRTFPLRNDEITEKGTLYIGNGEWGTGEGIERNVYNNTGLYEVVGYTHHYWVVNVSLAEGTISNTAYGQNNQVLIETKTQNIKDYIEV